jgi:Putative Ig domain/Regulator of chromosome condensation (RCC1) repeat
MAGAPSRAAAPIAAGQLIAFGDNFSGALGSATNNGTVTANPTPTPVSLPGAGGPVTQIAAGEQHTLALASTGQLYAFGDNTAGELGSAAGSGGATANPTPALVSLPAGTTIDTVARGPDATRTLALVADLGVASRSLAPAQIGVPYSTTAQGSGGAPPYRWSASGLPAGLSIDPTSGQITGTPTVPGRANVVLTLADADGITATSPTLPLKVARATPPAPTAAQLKASLRAQLVPSGRAAKIATLLQRNGYVVSFAALRAGVVVIDWYRVPKGAQLAARKATPVLVGAGKRRFAAAATLPITVRLTAKGRQLLAKATRLRLTARGAFSATGTSAIIAIRRFTLAR